MSNPLLNWAFSAPLTRSSEKFLLVCLANHANVDGTCFPSYASLSEQTALNRKTVIAGMRGLLSTGLIVDTGDRKGATKQIVVFRLIVGGIINPPETVPETELLEKSSKNGTVPILPDNSPVFSLEGSQKRTERVPKTGHGTTRNHQGTLMEPPVPGRDEVVEAIDVWNSICGAVGGMVQKISPPRRAAVKARLRENLGNDMERWRAYCQQIADTPGLSGLNDREWSADFDWAVKPANMIKVLEGKYRRWGTTPSRANNTATDLVLDLAMDLITPIEHQFREEPINGHHAAPSNGHSLAFEAGPPDGWWEDAPDEAADWPVRDDPRR